MIQTFTNGERHHRPIVAPQMLGHVVAGCSVHLNEKRYNYRHDSVLLNIVKPIKAQK